MATLSVIAVVCFFGFFVSYSEAKIWALLAAGLNGWDNYCDEAAVCRTYQLLISSGIPKENIVVMMFDDIANNKNNPYPGVIHTSENGPNVYNGVAIDYAYLNVSYKHVLSILRGDQESVRGIGTGRTLQSGPDDYVLVYLTSHGGPGFLGFIDGPLTSSDLVDTITYMHSKQRYKQMAIFVEGCNSGSLFNHLLPTNINAYAMTAANPFEPSMASNWDKTLQTYLCLYYSCAVLDTVDKSANSDSVEQLYRTVSKLVTESHVSTYGQESVAKDDSVRVFFGNTSSRQQQQPTISDGSSADWVAREDIRLAMMMNKIFASDNRQRKEILEQELLEELGLRQKMRETVRQIVGEVVGHDASLMDTVLHRPASPKGFDCLKSVIGHFTNNCYSFNKFNYAVHISEALVNLCEMGFQTKRIEDAIEKIC